MILETLLTQSFIALLGGFSAELLHWYSLSRKQGKIEEYKKSILYWGTTLGMILLGGIMPLLYIQDSASALLCFHLGAATPIIIQKSIANLPDITVAQGHQNTSIKDFFDW